MVIENMRIFKIGRQSGEPLAISNNRRAWGRLACGLSGLYAELWMMLYFSRHDAGIGGAPMLLFGPALIIAVSYAAYCLARSVSRYGLPTSHRHHHCEPLEKVRA